MKELNPFFDIDIPLKRHDVHWIEDELLKLREETCLKVFRQILVRIKAEALEGIKRCQSCGKERYLLEEAIGLEEGDETSFGVKERKLYGSALSHALIMD